LLEALAKQKDTNAWRFRHIGGGPLLDDLKASAKALGIEDRIDWLGAQPQEAVIDEYRKADVFVLASEIAPDGDRDGLPNVLMEAQSQRLPVVATRLAGIEELIVDGQTGLLCEPGDADGLAKNLGRMIVDASLRRHLALEGHRRLVETFSLSKGIDRLEARFRA
jgi:glycosyltransferase involved in cell wall biosynthesis